MNDQLTITVTGPRGSGKTTLCECLATMLRDLGQIVTEPTGPEGSPAEAMHKSLPIRIVDTVTP